MARPTDKCTIPSNVDPELVLDGHPSTGDKDLVQIVPQAHVAALANPIHLFPDLSFERRSLLDDLALLFRHGNV